MRADASIKSDVEAELRWSTEFDEKDIAIKVTHGVVALTGFVASSRHTAWAAPGVTRVTNNITVGI